MNGVKQAAERLAGRLTPIKPALGKLTLTGGIAMVLIGFPAQILANWRAQECRIDIVLVSVVLMLYFVRIPYQLSARAWYLLPADILGLFFAATLVGQWLYY